MNVRHLNHRSSCWHWRQTSRATFFCNITTNNREVRQRQHDIYCCDNGAWYHCQNETLNPFQYIQRVANQSACDVTRSRHTTQRARSFPATHGRILATVTYGTFPTGGVIVVVWKKTHVVLTNTPTIFLLPLSLWNLWVQLSGGTCGYPDTQCKKRLFSFRLKFLSVCVKRTSCTQPFSFLRSCELSHNTSHEGNPSDYREAPLNQPPTVRRFWCTVVLWSTNVSVESQSVFVSVPPNVIDKFVVVVVTTACTRGHSTISRRPGSWFYQNIHGSSAPWCFGGRRRQPDAPSCTFFRSSFVFEFEAHACWKFRLHRFCFLPCNDVFGVDFIRGVRRDRHLRHQSTHVKDRVQTVRHVVLFIKMSTVIHRVTSRWFIQAATFKDVECKCIVAKSI